MMTDQLVNILVSFCYLLGCRYMLGLGDIENDIKFVKREACYWTKRVFHLWQKSRFYTGIEMIHQRLGSNILKKAFS